MVRSESLCFLFVLMCVAVQCTEFPKESPAADSDNWLRRYNEAYNRIKRSASPNPHHHKGGGYELIKVIKVHHGRGHGKGCKHCGGGGHHQYHEPQYVQQSPCGGHGCGGGGYGGSQSQSHSQSSSISGPFGSFSQSSSSSSSGSGGYGKK